MLRVAAQLQGIGLNSWTALVAGSVETSWQSIPTQVVLARIVYTWQSDCPDNPELRHSLQENATIHYLFTSLPNSWIHSTSKDLTQQHYWLPGKLVTSTVD